MDHAVSWPLCFTRRSLNFYFAIRRKIFANLFLKILFVFVQFAVICSVALLFQVYIVFGIALALGISTIIFNDTGLFDLAVLVIDLAILGLFWFGLSLLALIDLLLFFPHLWKPGNRLVPLILFANAVFVLVYVVFPP